VKGHESPAPLDEIQQRLFPAPEQCAWWLA
jgi:hypothetical protein